VDDITVEEEGLEHQLFFQAAEAIEPLLMQMQMLTVNQLIGFYFKNSAAAATVVVILRHEPLKSAAGVASGSITNAGGATDAQITYPVQVK
jgi:hypothetical protein